MERFIRAVIGRRPKTPPAQLDRAPIDGCEVTETDFGDLPEADRASIDADIARQAARTAEADRVDPWRGVERAAIRNAAIGDAMGVQFPTLTAQQVVGADSMWSTL